MSCEPAHSCTSVTLVYSPAGGVSVVDCDLRIVGGSIARNTALLDDGTGFAGGGGIHRSASNGSAPTVCILASVAFSNNTAPGGRGGAIMDAGVELLECATDREAPCTTALPLVLDGVRVHGDNAALFGGGVYAVYRPPVASPAVRLAGPPVRLAVSFQGPAVVASGGQLPLVHVLLYDAYDTLSFPLAPNSVVVLSVPGAAIIAESLDAPVGISGRAVFPNATILAAPGSALSVVVSLDPAELTRSATVPLRVSACAPGTVVGPAALPICVPCPGGTWANRSTACLPCARGCMCPADATVPCAQHVTVAPLLLVYAAGTLPGVNVSILPPANAGGTVVCAVTSEGGVVAGQVSFQDSAPGAYISLQLVVLPGARSGLSVSCASGAQAVTVDIVAAALPCAAGYVPPTSPGGGCQQCAPGTWSWAGLPCQPCPHGAVCRGGTDLEPLPGYWRASNASVVAVPCPVPDACVGGAPGAAGCAAGYTSITCNVCAPGPVALASRARRAGSSRSAWWAPSSSSPSS